MSVVLEWDFSPSEYFEEAIEISRNDYTMTIGTKPWPLSVTKRVKL